MKKAQANQAGSVLRLYIDSHGSLYPDAQFLPTNTEFRANGGTASQLKNYYESASGAGLQRALYTYYHEDLLPHDKQPTWKCQAWQHIQTKLTADLANTIDITTQHGQRPLIILIHGYNVGDTAHVAANVDCDDSRRNKEGQNRLDTFYRTTPYYQTVRHIVEQRGKVPANAVWLEVYWDGLQLNPGARVWGAGQLNARYAGLRLREVLNRLAVSTPVRVFTHSAGGIVISQALWNNDAFSGGGTVETVLQSWMNKAATPTQSDMRVGMLVPALTPKAFDYYGKRTPQAMPQSIPKQRLVIARNKRDFIVSKFGLGSRWFGATGMGSDLNGLTYAEQQVAAFPHQLTGLSVCTTTSKQNTPAAYSMFGLEAHDWLLYSLPERKEKMEQFLALVFND